jgi:Lycopene cyclase
MISASYVYLGTCGVFLCVWLMLYLLRKDTRREMLTMSLLVGVVSICTLYFWYTIDWWHPKTLTGTRIGIEDFLIGFAGGGVMSACYEIVSGIRYRYSGRTSYTVRALALLVFLALITSVFFYGFSVTSFWSTVLGLSIATAVMLFFRPDLIRNSFLSGVLSLLLVLPAYGFILYASPTWVSQTYDWRYLSGILVFGIPIEELVFWFLSGLFFGPFYEFWKSGTIRRR